MPDLAEVVRQVMERPLGVESMAERLSAADLIGLAGLRWPVLQSRFVIWSPAAVSGEVVGGSPG